MDEKRMEYEAWFQAADLVLEMRPAEEPPLKGNRHERRKAAALDRRGGKRRGYSIKSYNERGGVL